MDYSKGGLWVVKNSYMEEDDDDGVVSTSVHNAICHFLNILPDDVALPDVVVVFEFREIPEMEYDGYCYNCEYAGNKVNVNMVEWLKNNT